MPEYVGRLVLGWWAFKQDALAISNRLLTALQFLNM